MIQLTIRSPDEVEKWLRGLGSLLPREAVAALVEEVHRRGMDGEALEALIASRATPALGDAVRPSHMATLRRCWNANRPVSGSMSRETTPADSERLKRFVPPARVQIEVRHEDLPDLQNKIGDAGDPQDCLEELAETAAEPGLSPETPLSSAMMKQKVVKPPQVPRLDLSLLHKHGNQDNLRIHEWKPGRTSNIAGSTTSGGDDLAKRSGFASASPEDQQRIAEFYGYRDEGFVATMTGLRTDVIRPRLYVGNMADAAYWPLLKMLGVTHIVNCAVEAQKVSPAYESEGVQYLLLPWQDREEEAQSLMKHRFRTLKGATKYIRGALQGSADNVVLLHCVQGMSRSAALACAYLMEFEGLGLDRALSEVRSKHKGCLTSPHWQTLLHKFNADLLRGS
mmetsp:Transcript_27014/g.62880  ORF Transcript_27014/g.62880 Transcript_27014/m.62880 type:complete len:396 (+) Transcript_27014:30-1217(+)